MCSSKYSASHLVGFAGFSCERAAKACVKMGSNKWILAYSSADKLDMIWRGQTLTWLRRCRRRNSYFHTATGPRCSSLAAAADSHGRLACPSYQASTRLMGNRLLQRSNALAPRCWPPFPLRLQPLQPSSDSCYSVVSQNQKPFSVVQHPID